MQARQTYIHLAWEAKKQSAGLKLKCHSTRYSQAHALRNVRRSYFEKKHVSAKVGVYPRRAEGSFATSP